MLMYARATSTCIHQHINVARTYINIHQHTSTYHLYDINGLKIKSRIYHESFIFLLFSSKNIKINKYYIEINSSTFQNYPHIQALILFSFFINSLILYYCLELYVTKIIVFLHKRVVIELLARKHLMQIPKRCSVRRLIFLNLK